MKNPWDKIEKPGAKINVLRVSAAHPLALYWGKDAFGAYLFIAEIPKETSFGPKDLPALEGIKISLAGTKDALKLIFTLNDTRDWGMFKALCFDLTRASAEGENGDAAMRILSRRLARWHDFLKHPRGTALSEAKIKGFVGELLFMENPLAGKFGWGRAVSFWKGPENAPQDFAVFDTAVELKCQTGSSRPSVEITSAGQLDTQLPRLFLVIQTVAAADEKADGAFTPNILVKRVRDALETEPDDVSDIFETLLFQTGYLPLPEYDVKWYRLFSTGFYEVRDGFPRLTADKIPDGISNVSYQINIAALAPFARENIFTTETPP